MKKIIAVCLILAFILSGCGDYESTPDVESNPVVDIVMPNDTNYYQTEDWTVENLIKEFESLGFTNIVTKYMGTPFEYRYGPVHTVSIDHEMFAWDEGDIYRSNDEVEISYYDPTPTLTSENCPELADILTGETSSWLKFAEEYDGQYIEFDGCVVERINDEISNDHIIYVCGGDFSSQTNKQQIRLTYTSTDSDVEMHVFYGSVGNNYKIIGKVDLDDSEYYNMLTIETVLVEDR